MPKTEKPSKSGKTKGEKEGKKSKSAKEGKEKKPVKEPVKESAKVVDKTDDSAKNASSTDPTLLQFEAGSVFKKYDLDGDGKLDKHEFTQLIKQHPNIIQPNPANENSFPVELVSHRLLTHFDETAGVAIPRSEIEQHRNLGSTVTPLVDSYKSRYDRLRVLLTGKLLPKREHLLQLRRQLQNVSTEVDATKRGIERETLTDTEQILERLRGIESMRQSSIKHQILHIEEELQVIERVVKRVEQANIDESQIQNTTGVLLTSAVPGSIPVETIRTPRALSMVELIHQFSDLSSTIETLALKPVTVQVDFPTDDFPRETTERLEVISRCDKYMHAISVKDHMLWAAIKEKEAAEESLQEERKLSYEYAQEVANWAEVSQNLTKQLLAQKQENEKLAESNRELKNIMRDHNMYYASNM